MAFDFSTLITDRSQGDLDALRDLLNTPISDWTAEQLAEFNQAASKGAYNYTDLNRVTAAMEYLVEQLNRYGYSVDYQKIKIDRSGEIIFTPDESIEFLLKASGESIVDESDLTNEITVHGNVSVDHDNGLFDYPAVKFGGTSEDYLTIPKLSLAGEWTLEWWEKRTALNNDNGAAILHTVNGTGGMIVARESGGNLGIFASSSNSNAWNAIPVTTIGSADIDTWIFRTIVCDGNELRVYTNGKKIATTSYSAVPYSGSYWLIGKRSGYSGINGLVQDLRFSTKARYTEDFEPPKSPLLAGEVQFNPSGKDPYLWYEEDIPTVAQMERYLLNVVNIYNVLLSNPELPATMAQLDYNGANQIEKAMLLVEETIERVVKSMCRSNAFTFWSGNRPLPSEESDLGRTWKELDSMNTAWRNWQVADWYMLLYGNLKAEGVVE